MNFNKSKRQLLYDHSYNGGTEILLIRTLSLHNGQKIYIKY